MWTEQMIAGQNGGRKFSQTHWDDNGANGQTFTNGAKVPEPSSPSRVREPLKSIQILPLREVAAAGVVAVAADQVETRHWEKRSQLLGIFKTACRKQCRSKKIGGIG